MSGLTSLIHKYSGPGPRYTSYPTAPQWTDSVGPADYAQCLKNFANGVHANGPSVDDKKLLGMYVHIPFCESLCYYCGCNIQITHDHSRSASYVNALEKELDLIAAPLDGKATLSQISWGGGTPTFLSLEEMRRLFEATTKRFSLHPDAEVSIEIDPRVTSDEKLQLLRSLGFNRVSLGVQDFNEDVQKAVNRVQPEAMTARMLDTCRKLGFRGINFDLIYGLPLQSPPSFKKTLEAIVRIGPDRIALYNYARLPSLLKHQTILEKHPMPGTDERVEIFTMALEMLRDAGYIAIGMDHFAKKTDELASAVDNGSLYRNFMGYTVRRARHMVGVGASAIGEVGGGFFQNTKKASDYEKCVGEGRLATARGLVLSTEDEERKWIIQSLMCGFELKSEAFEENFGAPLNRRYAGEIDRLKPFVDDGILERDQDDFKVTETGRLFLRNVSMVFDAYLNAPQKATFSQTV